MSKADIFIGIGSTPMSDGIPAPFVSLYGEDQDGRVLPFDPLSDKDAYKFASELKLLIEKHTLSEVEIIEYESSHLLFAEEAE